MVRTGLPLSILLCTTITSIPGLVVLSKQPLPLSLLLPLQFLLRVPVPAAMAQLNSRTDTSTGTGRTMKLAGGWYDAKVNDPDVLEAAAFCLQSFQANVLDSDQRKPDYSFALATTHGNGTTTTPIQTLKIIQATKQVVAGMNYALTLMLLKGNECVGVFKATVYNRFGELSLTKWGGEIPCTEGMLIMEAEQLDPNGDSN